MADFDFKAASESMMDFIKKVETENTILENRRFSFC